MEAELNKFYAHQVPFVQISKEALINYPGLKQLSYSTQFKTNFKKVDTITSFNAEWYDAVKNKRKEELRFKKWLKTRLNLDSLIINGN